MRTILSSLSFPFIIGLLLGFLYPHVGAENKHRIQSAIGGFGNPELFNILALVSVIALSVLVLAKGPIPKSPSRLQRAVGLWLPGLTLATCVPFFTSVAGFLTGLPKSPSVFRLFILALIGFVCSAALLLLLVLPAHTHVFPTEPKLKRLFYAIVLPASLVSAAWFYGV